MTDWTRIIRDAPVSGTSPVDRAAPCARYPTSARIASTRWRVSVPTPTRPLRTFDAVASETRACRATAASVTRDCTDILYSWELIYTPFVDFRHQYRAVGATRRSIGSSTKLFRTFPVSIFLDR